MIWTKKEPDDARFGRTAENDIKEAKRGIIGAVNLSKPAAYHYAHLHAETHALDNLTERQRSVLRAHMYGHIAALRIKGQSTEDIARGY